MKGHMPSVSRKQESWKQLVKVGVNLLIIISVIYLGSRFVTEALNYMVLEILVPKRECFHQVTQQVSH